MSYLGNLVGDTWAQYWNAVGQVYFCDIATGESQYSIPTGWEDTPQDTWNYNGVQQHWVNVRTGRIIFMDPNPPLAQTYLENAGVSVSVKTVERDPAASEALYRRVKTGVLKWLFKDEDGYNVVQEDSRERSIPDHVVLKIECRPGGSMYTYDFMMVEVKKAGQSWEATKDQCANHCENTENESHEVYAMIQVAMELKFYLWKNTTLTPLTNKLHLRRDVQQIMAWADYLRTHPIRAI